MFARVLAGLGLAVAAACGPASVESAGAVGYPAPFEAVTDATEFVGSPLVVLATVESVGDARWNGPGGRQPTGTERPAYLWTPVVTRVDRVLRGQAGPALTVRVLGGTQDGATVVVGDADPLPVPAPGTHVLLFLNPLVDAGDGFAAATPNHAYTVAGGVATASNGSHALPLDELVELVEAGPGE